MRLDIRFGTFVNVDLDSTDKVDLFDRCGRHANKRDFLDSIWQSPACVVPVI